LKRIAKAPRFSQFYFSRINCSKWYCENTRSNWFLEWYW